MRGSDKHPLGGGLKQKCPPWEGGVMDIFWNYTIRVAFPVLEESLKLILTYVIARGGRAFANPWATPGYLHAHGSV